MKESKECKEHITIAIDKAVLDAVERSRSSTLTLQIHGKIPSRSSFIEEILRKKLHVKEGDTIL